MKEEPVYIDIGDEFDIEDNSWKYHADFENEDIIEEVFLVCGRRKYFKSKKEARKWRIIDGQISRKVLGLSWVFNCIDWAKTKNEGLCAIKVGALGSLILNKARMQDWLMDHGDDISRPETYF